VHTAACSSNATSIGAEFSVERETVESNTKLQPRKRTEAVQSSIRTRRCLVTFARGRYSTLFCRIFIARCYA